MQPCRNERAAQANTHAHLLRRPQPVQQARPLAVQPVGGLVAAPHRALHRLHLTLVRLSVEGERAVLMTSACSVQSSVSRGRARSPPSCLNRQHLALAAAAAAAAAQ